MLRIFLVVIGFMFLFVSCMEMNKENNQEIDVTDIYHSDCVNVWKSDQNEIEQMLLKADGDSLNIDHLNAVFNCCLDEGIGVDIEVKEDSILIREFEVVLGICDCICPYNIKYKLGPLEKKEYVLCYKRPDGGYYFCYDFMFSSDLDIELTIE